MEAFLNLRPFIEINEKSLNIIGIWHTIERILLIWHFQFVQKNSNSMSLKKKKDCRFSHCLFMLNLQQSLTHIRIASGCYSIDIRSINLNLIFFFLPPISISDWQRYNPNFGYVFNVYVCTILNFPFLWLEN